MKYIFFTILLSLFNNLYGEKNFVPASISEVNVPITYFVIPSDDNESTNDAIEYIKYKLMKKGDQLVVNRIFNETVCKNDWILIFNGGETESTKLIINVRTIKNCKIKKIYLIPPFNKIKKLNQFNIDSKAK